MKSLSVVFTLLVLATSPNRGEASRKPELPSTALPDITSSLTYEYGIYSCESQKATALLTVKTSKTTGSPPVLSLTSVMDVSSSMEADDKMTLMLDTNDFLLKELAGLDRPHKFGTVTFSSEVAELTPLEVIAEGSLKGISDTIKGTRTSGLTDLFGGIEKGFEQQSQDADTAKYVRIVFVFTDGIPTIGTTQPDKIIERVKALVQQWPDVAIYTFGYGSDLNYDLLRRIAEIGRGTVSIIDKPRKMARAFGAALGGLLSQVADSIVYTATPKNGAKITGVSSGGEIKQQGESYEIHLGDMQQEERRTVIIHYIMGKSCTSADPVDIVGSSQQSGSGKAVTDKSKKSKFKRKQNPDPSERVQDEDVAAEMLRYGEFDRRYNAASRLLAKGDKAGAIQALKDLEGSLEITASAKNKKWVEAALSDTRNLIKRMEMAPSSDIHLRADLDSVWDAIGKQRTGSTSEELESVALITTPAKKSMIEKAEVAVLGISSTSLFTLSASYAVLRQKIATGYDVVSVNYILKAPPMAGRRPPLSLTIVIDTSQSMDGDPMKTVVKTLKRLVDWLISQGDVEASLGVITFADTAQELLVLTKISALDVPGVKASFDAIKPGGTAKVEEALKKGVDQQLAKASCLGSRAVFLLSNSALSSSSNLLIKALKAQLASAKFPVYVYTFAMEQSDAEPMGKIADAGNGQAYILPSVTDIPYSFGDAVGGLLGMAGKNVTIAFMPGSADVEIVSVFPGELQGQGSVNVSSLNIFETENRQFLVSVRFPEASDPATILKISASYINASTCGIANSAVIAVGRDEKASSSIKQRQLEKAVAVELKQAIDECMTAVDVQEVIQRIDLVIIMVATSRRSRLTRQLIADIADIRYRLLYAHKGIAPRDDGCARAEALVDLLESERSKATDSVVFLVSQRYDTKARQKSRVAIAEGLFSPTACRRCTPTAQELHARISVWNRDADMTDLHGTERQGETRVPTNVVEAVVRDALYARKTVTEAIAVSLARVDAALARNDFATATNEILAALDQAQGSSHRDDSIVYASICHLVARGDMLLRSVNAGCFTAYGPYGSTHLTERSKVRVDETANGHERTPQLEAPCPFVPAALNPQ